MDTEEGMLYYGFSYEEGSDNFAIREGYKDAYSVLAHL
jgi:hypothetical protein